MRGIEQLLQVTEGVTPLSEPLSEEQQKALEESLDQYRVACPPGPGGFRLAILVGCRSAWMVTEIFRRWPATERVLLLERSAAALRGVGLGLPNSPAWSNRVEFCESLLQNPQGDATAIYTAVLGFLIKHNLAMRDVVVWESPEEVNHPNGSVALGVVRDLFDHFSTTLLRIAISHPEAIKPSFLRLWGRYLERFGRRFHAAKILYYLAHTGTGDSRDVSALFSMWLQLGSPEMAEPLLERVFADALGREQARVAITQNQQARKIQQDSFFRQNLAALDRVDPDTARLLAHWTGKAELHVALETDIPWKYLLLGHPPQVVADVYPIFFRVEDGLLVEINRPNREMFAMIQALASERINRHVLVLGLRHFDQLLNFQLNPLQLNLPNWHQCFHVVEPDFDTLHGLLHGIDLSDIFTRTGNRFYFGENGLNTFLSFLEENPIRLIPKICLGLSAREMGFLWSMNHRRERQLAINREIIAQARPFCDWQPLVAGQQPWRILLVTSCFTTVLQFVIADLARAFRDLGHETLIVRDEQACEWLNGSIVAQEVLRFRPNAVFAIDHIRPEFNGCVPADVPFICWVQDLLPHLSDERLVRELGPMDLTYCLNLSWNSLLKGQGYPHAEVLHFGVDTERFAPMPDLPPADDTVAFITHLHRQREPREMPGLFAWLDGWIGEDESRLFLPTRQVVEQVCQAFRLELQPLYSDSIFLTVTNYLRQMDRLRVADWLREAGIPLALYGEGWETFPRFAPFARGTVANGPPLVAAYQRHKVLLHLGWGLNMHNRVFEAIAAGGFVMVRHEDYDYTPDQLNDHLTLGEEIIAFRDRQDLINLIGRAFTDETWRQGVIRAGRAKVVRNESYHQRAAFLIDQLRQHVVRETRP